MEQDDELAIMASAGPTRELGPVAVGLAARGSSSAISDIVNSSLGESLERISSMTSGIANSVVGSSFASQLGSGVFSYLRTSSLAESVVGSSAISDLASSSFKDSLESMSTITSGIANSVVGSSLDSQLGSGVLSDLVNSSLGESLERISSMTTGIANSVVNSSAISDLASSFKDSLERMSTITSGIADRVPELWDDSGVFARVDRLSEVWDNTILREDLLGLGESPGFSLNSLGLAGTFAMPDVGRVTIPSAILDPPVHVVSRRPYEDQLDRIGGVVADLHSARAEERAAQLAVPGLLERLLYFEETQVLMAREAESRQDMRADEARVRADWNLRLAVVGIAFAAAVFVQGLL